MPSSHHSLPRNVLLRSLPPDALDLLRPHLERVQVHRDDVLVRPDVPFEHVWFPESGLASVVSESEDGHRAEVGAFGHDGMVSTALVLGVDRTPHLTFVQVGGIWLRAPAEVLARAMRHSPALHGLLLRYVQAFLMFLSRTALANAGYTTEERLARWLLVAHDRMDGDELPLTHGFLSLMLGVHRPGVTVALHTLEGASMIRAKRGLITVRDRGKLEDAAGGSYGVAEAEYERLIGPFRKHGAGSVSPHPEDVGAGG